MAVYADGPGVRSVPATSDVHRLKPVQLLWRFMSIDLEAIQIYLDDVCIVSQGGRDPGYSEEQGQAVMAQEEITIKVDLNAGAARACVWTSDLSYDYVKINAEYRT